MKVLTNIVLMRFQMSLVMCLTQVTFVANVAGVLSEAFLSVSFVVKKFHVTLVKNSPPELHVAHTADVSLFHVRFNVTRSS